METAFDVNVGPQQSGSGSDPSVRGERERPALSPTQANADPRTILFVHDGNGPLRGSEMVAFALLDGIDQQRYRWIVLTNHPEFAAGCRARGIPTEFRTFRMLFAEGFRIRDLGELLRFVVIGTRLARRRNISLVHINNGGSCSWMIPAAWICGLQVVVHLHAHWSRKMRFVLGLHFADKIIGVCNSVLDGFRTDPVAARRLGVIYNGLDCLEPERQERLAARAKFIDEPDTIIVGVIAALVDAKRVDIAIEAIRRLPPDVASQTRLLIVGEGQHRASLEKQATGLPVTFAGHRTDVHELLLNVVDVVVLPSESEAFSIVLLEAAAAALPRIASNIGGIRKSITNDVDGILVPVGNPDELAAAIARLVRDPDLRRRYGVAAEKRLRAEFNVGQFLGAFAALYDEMCDTPNPARTTKFLDVIRSGRNQLTSRPRTTTGATIGREGG